MKYGWVAILALFQLGGVATADDGAFGRTAMVTVRVSLYIPAQFEATLANEEVCVQSTGAGPYEIALDATSPSSPSHCIGTAQITVPDGQPLTLWVRPE